MTKELKKAVRRLTPSDPGYQPEMSVNENTHLPNLGVNPETASLPYGTMPVQYSTEGVMPSVDPYSFAPQGNSLYSCNTQMQSMTNPAFFDDPYGVQKEMTIENFPLWMQKDIVKTAADSMKMENRHQNKMAETRYKKEKTAELEEDKARIREEFQLRRELQTYEVKLSEANKLMIAPVKLDGSTYFDKTIMDAVLLLAVRYKCDYPDEQDLLVTDFFVGREKRTVTVDLLGNNPPKTFLWEIRRKLDFNVNPKKEKEFAGAIFHYLLLNAEVKEIAPAEGYFLNKENFWSFAEPGSPTMNAVRTGDTEIRVMKGMPKNPLFIILRIFAIVFPVLWNAGIRPDRPIVLLTDNFTKLAEQLTNLKAEICTGDNYSKKMSHTVTVSMDFLLGWFNGSFKSESMLKQIQGLIETGIYEEKRICSFPLLIAKSRIPANVLDEALYIEIDEKQDVGIEFPTYISDISTFMAIGEQIEQLDKELDDTGRSLKAAVCFLYPMLKKINHLDVYQSLLEYVDRIIELDEEAADPEGIPEFFIDELTKAVRNYHCYSLKEITDLPVNWKMGCFYSQKYLFLSQDLFEKFAESLHLRVKTNQLKRILTDAGVLSPGNGKFTAKMNIQTENGLKRQNMLRFPLEKLNQVGRPEFIYFLNGGK